MTSVDDGGDDPVEAVAASGQRAGVGGSLLRAVGLVAVVAGVVLGVLGWSALGDAAEDEDALSAIDAEQEDLAAQLATKERRRERRLDRIAADQQAGRELQDAVQVLSSAHSGFFDDIPETAPIMDRAVEVWNAGDHAGAVAILDAEMGGPIALMRNRLERVALAQAVVTRGARRLPEPPR